jgi:acyl carrier protein
MIKHIKELYEIIQPDFLINEIEDKTSMKLNWKEMDTLDIIEIIMDIEKEYDISISDDLLDEIETIGFHEIYLNLISVKRDCKLNELGI